MLSTGGFRSQPSGPPSPLKGVPSTAWQRFVAVLEVQPVSAVSESGGLGAFDIRPRRLVELGYATALQYTKSDTGRYIHTCEFVLPRTQARFLVDPNDQHKVLSQSILLYRKALEQGKPKRPDGVSLSGALAILHCGGRGALEGWPKLFDNTRALYEAARGLF